jgi:isoleucyl-tRNA synthetase
MEAGGLRTRALEAIAGAEWFPDWGRDRITNMIANRPDWCISRQRAWGVPIPAVDCISCGEPILTEAVTARAADVFEEHGADSWYELPIEAFLPEGFKCPSCGQARFEREANILDVWFDSGSSHEAVLARRSELRWPADLYLEGSDQHRGWFHSSLLIGVATYGDAPYRQVLTHGFVVDEGGRKMSKSIGNTIEPQDVTAQSGAEILRLWTSMVDYREEVRLSRQILARVVEAYRKLRNTCRILLANLYDFDPVKDSLRPGKLQEVDRYALARYADAAIEIVEAYRTYDFPAIFQLLNGLATVDLSAFYVDVSKDRLYTFSPRAEARRSAQTAMYIIADGLTRLIAPILPVTAEELWSFLPGKREESVHLADFPAHLSELTDPDLVSRWTRLIAIRDQVNAAIEVQRKAKLVGNSLEAAIRITAAGDDLALLTRNRADLEMLFIVSSVALQPGDGLAIEVSRAPGVKCERCWRYVPSVSSDPGSEGICERCQDALAEAVNQ